ncbi:uncharacterized protein NECHADRAFT_98719 [Fusarium vanettenii 77-13-4]|uniref:Uncharacterized protein n=1 Tax=Fusarium vanettenii (strain ATCC MYA-4622 / CBS 123669 / FGSC 9596 / NRRL 45880 / 77-13-4) TaxID=660122 RepID=C7YKE9_FUSV7|nr:uncharacterized protein NECHADRAFT_98719 [Fusarium vanettenii 77-13-4]EEU48443.1 hypothetical protein NECHADRAFT_98719 [Fusarium vanettenii 77-13-4]
MNDSEIKIIVIVLATVVPLTAITAVGCFLYRRSRQRQRRFLFLKRGITPIDDEEIESWRTDKSLEKTPIIEATSNHGHSHSLEQQLQQHQRQKSTSVSSIRKPPSVIIYNSPNPHEEISSPRSLHHKRSIDVPSTPLLARAPNSRPGLTDETVQGDDAFVSPLKRQPSRLAKLPPSASRHGRTRSSRSSTVSAISPRDPWHGHYPDSVFGPRSSSEYIPRANRSLDIRRQHHRMHSMISPSRMSFDDEVFMGGLSPRPLIRKSEIGRAIG